MAIYEVDEENIRDIMQREFAQNKIVVLKFESPLCDSCQALDFELEELEENNSNVSILTIDCNDCPDLAEFYEIQRVPTLMIYTNPDNVIYNQEGIILYQDIQKLIDNQPINVMMK